MQNFSHDSIKGYYNKLFLGSWFICTIEDILEVAENKKCIMYRCNSYLEDMCRKQKLICEERCRKQVENNKVRVGSCIRAKQIFQKPEFISMLQSGAYGMVTDGCQELNDGNFSYYLVKLDPNKQHRMANCEWVFEKYAESVQGRQDLDKDQQAFLIGQITGNRVLVKNFLNNKVVRQLYNYIMSCGYNGWQNYMVCYDKSTGGLMIIEEY